MGYDGWDAYYARLHRLISDSTSATTPSNVEPNLECYHVVASVHEDSKSDAEGRVTSVVPSVQGKMNSHLTAFFSCHLLMDPQELKGERTYQVRTTSAGLRHCKGDQIGGGRYQKLPNKLGGTYPELAKAWGMTGDSK